MENTHLPFTMTSIEVTLNVIMAINTSSLTLAFSLKGKATPRFKLDIYRVISPHYILETQLTVIKCFCEYLTE